MAPLTGKEPGGEANHQALLDKLDIYASPKPFRNPNWKPPQRRNKNLKQILADAQRKEAASMMPSNAASGSSTPAPGASDVATSTGAMTPASTNGSAASHSGGANLAQAAQRLDRLVLERSHQASLAAPGTTAPGSSFGGGAPGPSVTYTNIEAAPSLHPSSRKKYCDITGLPASYTDPKSGLRYYNKEIYGHILMMPETQKHGYLAARGAHTVLK